MEQLMWRELKSIEESSDFGNLDPEMLSLVRQGFDNAFSVFQASRDNIITNGELKNIIIDRKSLIEKAHALSCRGKSLNDIESQLGRVIELKTVGEMLMGTIHDAKNILNPIGMYPNIWRKFIYEPIVDKNELPDELDMEEFEIGLRSVTSMVERLDNLFSVLKSTGKVDSTLKMENLDYLIHDCVNNLTQNLNTEICIESEIIAKVPKGHIYRMVANLIVNAKHALEEKYGSEYKNKGIVRVVLTIDNGLITLKVRDNGCGIDDETKDKMFDEWFTTKEDVGTGLGLAIVSQTLTLIDADIKVDTVVDEYTEFTITFKGEKGRIEHEDTCC